MPFKADKPYNELPPLPPNHELETRVVLKNCRIGNLVDAGIAKRQTASVYLKKLVEIGVLREIRVGREKLFVNPKLIGVITTSNDFHDYS